MMENEEDVRGQKTKLEEAVEQVREFPKKMQLYYELLPKQVILELLGHFSEIPICLKLLGHFCVS